MAINVKTGFDDGEIFTSVGGVPAPITRADLAADPAFTARNVPSGGTTSQVLAKNSNTNYDTEWVDPGGVGGTVDVGDVTGLAAFVEAYMANTAFYHSWDGAAWEAADGGATDTDPDKFHVNISVDDPAATTPAGVRVGDMWVGTD
jgi:hypothetical protein